MKNSPSPATARPATAPLYDCARDAGRVRNHIDFNADMMIVADSSGLYHRPLGTVLTDPSPLRLVFRQAEYRYKASLDDHIAVREAAAAGDEKNLRMLLDSMFASIGMPVGAEGWTLVQYQPAVLLTPTQSIDLVWDFRRASGTPPADPQRKLLRHLRERKLSQVFFQSGVKACLGLGSKELLMTEPPDVAKFICWANPSTPTNRLFDPIDAVAREIARIASDSEYKQVHIGDKDLNKLARAIDDYVRACFKPKFPVFAVSYEMLAPIIQGGMWSGEAVRGALEIAEFFDKPVDVESLLELTVICNKSTGHISGVMLEMPGGEEIAECSFPAMPAVGDIVIGVLEGDVLEKAQAMIAFHRRKLEHSVA